MVSKGYVAREWPADLRHTIQSAIELSPPTARGVVPTDYYGYSDDRSWEVKMELRGSRLVKRRQRAQVPSMVEADSFTYLLTRQAAISSSSLNRIIRCILTRRGTTAVGKERCGKQNNELRFL